MAQRQNIVPTAQISIGWNGTSDHHVEHLTVADPYISIRQFPPSASSAFILWPNPNEREPSRYRSRSSSALPSPLTRPNLSLQSPSAPFHPPPDRVKHDRGVGTREYRPKKKAPAEKKRTGRMEKGETEREGIPRHQKKSHTHAHRWSNKLCVEAATVR